MLKSGEFLVAEHDAQFVFIPEEFNEEHIEGAVLINIYSPDFNDRINSLDKNCKYLVYCRSGNRSNKAAIRMNEISIKTAYNLLGGIIALKKAGKKTVK